MLPLKRMPPPPPIAIDDPVFNRWLHDLTSFISDNGGIDPDQIPGYNLLVQTVNGHTTELSALTSQVDTNTADITTNTTNIAANAAAIATHTSQIATLNAQSEVFNGTAAPAAGLGVNGDWFSDTVAKHIYVKTGGAWVMIV